MSKIDWDLFRKNPEEVKQFINANLDEESMLTLVQDAFEAGAVLAHQYFVDSKVTQFINTATRAQIEAPGKGERG